MSQVVNDPAIVGKGKHEKVRYYAKIYRYGLAHTVRLITIHTIPTLGEDAEHVETESESVSIALGMRWARWKALRMIAAAKRRDRRERQPWVED